MINVNYPQPKLTLQYKEKRVREEPSHQHTNSMMNLIIWNIRGKNNLEFERHCSSMTAIHKPSMISLLKTRMTDYLQLTQDFGYEYQIPSSAIERSGGIILMWRSDIISINDIFITPQGFHMDVKVTSHLASWFCSIIYASSTLKNRKLLWKHVGSIVEIVSSSYNSSWLVGGDFKEVSKPLISLEGPGSVILQLTSFENT